MNFVSKLTTQETCFNIYKFRLQYFKLRSDAWDEDKPCSGCMAALLEYTCICLVVLFIDNILSLSCTTEGSMLCKIYPLLDRT